MVRNEIMFSQSDLDCLMHLVDVIRGPLAVVGEADTEDDGVDTVKQVQPLPPLRPLTTNVMDTKYHVLQASISVKLTPDIYWPPTLMWNLTSTMPDVLTLVWRMSWVLGM